MPVPTGEAVDSGNDPLSDPRLGPIVARFQEQLDAGLNPDRQAFLNDHPDLADVLDGCLRALEFVRAAMTPHGPDETPRDQDGARSDARFSDFRIVREIGRGGMGIVYEAEQISLGRKVALKVLPALAALDERSRQRFRHEAQASASLRHPHIAPVYGCDQSGDVHYFWMPYIDGPSLAQILRASQIRSAPAKSRDGSAADRLIESATSRSPDYYRTIATLIRDAADALQHAHESGIIHRDIKPGNLLVDSRGSVWVVDFGLARLPGSDLTGTADLLGTLRYVSPEQASGRAILLNGQTDVYSLGATCYELLTLRPAFPAQDRESLLSDILQRDPPAPRSINPGIPVELETIVQKAMAKEPAERYRSAREMKEDLDRFLTDRPILAKPPSLGQRVGKWVRRNRRLVAMASACAVMALVAVAVILGISRQQLAEKQEVTQNALNGETAARQELGIALANEKAARAKERWTSYAHTLAFAWREFEAGNSSRARELLDRAPEEHRGWEHRFLLGQIKQEIRSLTYFTPSENPLPSRITVLLSDDAKTLAISDPVTYQIRLFDVATWTERSTFHTPRLSKVLLSADGTTLVAYTQRLTILGKEKVTRSEVAVMNCGEGPKQIIAQTEIPHAIHAASINPKSPQVAFSLSNGTVQIWNWAEQKTVATFGRFGSGSNRIEFHPDGQRLAVAAEDSVLIVDAKSGRELHRLPMPQRNISFLGWHPTGKYLGIGMTYGNLAIVAEPFSKVLHTIQQGTTTIRGLSFSPDGQYFAVVNDSERTVSLYSVKEGKTVRTLSGHDAGTNQVHYVLNGLGLLTVGNDHRIKLWDGSGLSDGLYHSANQLTVMNRQGRYFTRFVHLPEPDRRATIEIYDADTRTVVQELNLPGFLPSEYHFLTRTAVFSEDGRSLTVMNFDGHRHRYDLQTAQRVDGTSTVIQDRWPKSGSTAEILEFGSRGSPFALMSPDGNVLAISRVNDFSLREVLTDRELLTQPMVKGIGPMQFSRDSRYLFKFTAGSNLHVWDVVALQQAGLLSNIRPKSDGAFSIHPGNQAVAVLSSGNVLEEYDWKSGSKRKVWEGAPSGAICISYSPDGKQIAVGLNRYHNRQGGVLILDARTGEEMLTIPVEIPVTRLEFSAEGSRLVLSDNRGQVKFINISEGAELSPEESFRRLVGSVSAWHEFELKRCELQGSVEPAIWHLEHLRKLRPDMPRVAERKAALIHKSGDFQAVDSETMPHLERLLTTSNKDQLLTYALAARYLRDNDAAGYQRLCRTIRDKHLMKADSFYQSVMLRMMTLGPDALGDPKTLLDLIPKVPGRNNRENTKVFIEGSSLYRAGKFPQALPLLQKACTLNEKMDFHALCLIFLAMTEHQLGQTEQARKHLAEVDAWAREVYGANPRKRENPDRKVDLFFPVLRAEAAALIAPQ